MNYCEVDPDDEATIINTQTREFDGWRSISDTLEYIDQLMSGPMHEAEGKPGIIITRLQDETATCTDCSGPIAQTPRTHCQDWAQHPGWREQIPAAEKAAREGLRRATGQDTCPCDSLSARKPGYRLCPTCLEIASANGIDIDLYRE